MEPSKWGHWGNGPRPREAAPERGTGRRTFREHHSHLGSFGFKALKLHLKASKSLLSPCLIALKAFKPLLQDGKPMGAKPLAPVGLWMLPAGTAGTRLPCLGGRDERAAASTSGGDRGDGPPTPRGTVCPHLLGLRASSHPQTLPSRFGAWWLKAGEACMGPASRWGLWELGSPGTLLQTPQCCGEKRWGYPGARPRVLGSRCRAWQGSD